MLRLQKINEYYIHHWNDFFMNSYSEILIFSLHQTTVTKNTTQGVFHASCPVIPYPIIINLRQSLPEKSPIFGFGSRFPETVFLFFIINFKALLQFSSHQWQTITLTLLIYNRQWTCFELRIEMKWYNTVYGLVRYSVRWFCGDLGEHYLLDDHSKLLLRRLSVV